jgi:hypothetical protein
MTTTATTTTTATGYTLLVINGNTWRIYDKNESAQETKKTKKTKEMLEHYYFYDDASNVKKLALGQGIKKSFPHHHCLMRASLSSAQAILDDNCPHRFYATTDVFQPAGSINALARIHDANNEGFKTPFTKLTAHQKNYLHTQSAMAGLLVSRLFGFSSAKPYTIKCLKKHADLTAKYIHSAFASECLIGNRYYYNLPTVLSEKKSIVGIENNVFNNIKAEDATREKIQENRAQLIELYNSNIERLENAVKQFKRGFLPIQTIREDSELNKLLEKFWTLQRQCMKYREVTDSGMSARQSLCEKKNITFDRKYIEVVICNLVFSCQAICPMLFSYDVAHLFDNCAGSYARYVKVVRDKQLEMCKDGLISAFLAFSAIEPKMVSRTMAPHLEQREWYYPEFSNYGFHIPSRDAIFGQLLSKHRVHIPRPVKIVRTFFVNGNNKDCFYLPVQEAFDELLTGKKVAKEMWKKNKKNFIQNH